MTKYKILLSALVLTTFLKAQSLYYRNFDLQDKAPQVALSEEELKKNKAIILEEIKAREMVFSAEGDLEQYLFAFNCMYVNDESIIDKLNKIYIPVSSPQDLVTLKCRITRPDGKTTELYKGDMKTVNEDGDDYFILALEGVEKKCIIEYYYLRRTRITYYNSESINNKYLVKKYTSQMISPENLVFVSKTYNNMPAAKDTVIDNRNFHSFNLLNLEPVADERYTTNYEKLMRYEIKLDHNKNRSSQKLFTYSDIAKNLITGYYTMEPGDEKAVKKVFKKLKLDKLATTDEKVFAIESFIKNDVAQINYDGPGSLSLLLSKNVLTSAYQNKLFVLLLTKAGIDYEVLSTSYKNNHPFDPEFESYAMLDETIFYIPETKKFLLMDNLVCRYGEIPAALLGQKGLFIKPVKLGESMSALNSIKDLPPIDGSLNYDNLEVNITFNPTDEKTLLGIKRTLGGYSAQNWRPYYHYYEGEKKQATLEESVKIGFDKAKVTNPSAQNHDMKDFNAYNKPYIVTGTLEVSELTEKAGSNFVFKIGNCIGPQAELYQEEKRKYDIYDGYPHSYKRVLTFTLPEGYTLQGAEKLNMNVELKEGDKVTAFFKSEYKLEGRVLTVTIYESYDKEFYSKDVFEGYRKVINAAADFNKISILLKKS